MHQQEQTKSDPEAAEELVRLIGVSKSFDKSVALHPVDLTIRRGDFFALLGPSGCGKTTLLKMIGGFLPPSTGLIEIEGKDVTKLPPEARRTGMVFQGYGLFPHMTVRQNIGYGLRIAKRPPAEIDKRVGDMIDLVQLGGMADRLPAELSGGQQQRVALGRSLVMEPAVLLLDESLAALDLKLRKAMQEELRALHRSIGGTFVFVTHDQGEAMSMANRIAVMKDGRIIQQGTPEEIYDNPQCEFVAGFVGDANVLKGIRRSGVIELDAGAQFVAAGPDGRVAVVIRPDRFCMPTPGSPRPEAAVSCQTEDIVFMGTHVRVSARAEAGVPVTLHLGPAEAVERGIARGQRFDLGWLAANRRIIEIRG